MGKLDRTDAPAVAEHATVYLAFELSKAKWKLGVLLPGSQKLSRYTTWQPWPLGLRTCARKPLLPWAGGRCASCHATKRAWTAIGCTDG
jgi:hypothetical protein